MMKAIIWTRYGPPDVLQLREVETPSPRDDELLIRVRATTVTTGDCELRRFKNLGAFWLPMRIRIGLLKPTRIRILGQELAGEIEATGKGVTSFKEGDRVFAATGFQLGAYAQYTCLPADGMVALKPTNMTFAEAAAVPLGGLEAWHYLRRANLQPGEKVLINGAGGSIGTIAVQLARHFGAEVTAVDSGGKLEMLRSIGAERVLDYTQEDFTVGDEHYDLVLDVIGSSSHGRCEGVLKENGRYLSANPGLLPQLRGLWSLLTTPRDTVAEYTKQRREALESLRELVEAGHIGTVVDRHYRFDQMAEAHRYVETGRKKGNVVVTTREVM